MKAFFYNIYKLFGIRVDMADHLIGFDLTCQNFDGTPYYIYIGFFMVLATAFIYALQYHIIDNTRYKSKFHWWIFALIIFVINFIVAFSITYNSISSGDYCNELSISTFDCFSVGFINSIWGIILFIIITTLPYPKKYSINCKHTTFWKP